MTVEPPSYGREGGRFRMTDEPSYGHERVKVMAQVEEELCYLLNKDLAGSDILSITPMKEWGPL